MHGNALAAVGLAAVLLAAGSFLLVLRESWRGTIAPRTVLWLAIGYHAALLFLPLLFSRDVYSYTAYGRIAAVHPPTRTSLTPADFPTTRSPGSSGRNGSTRPPSTDRCGRRSPRWSSVASTTVAASSSSFRAIAVAASLGSIAIVARLVRRRSAERESFAVAVIGLNPLVLFQSVASGHNDLLVTLAVAAALALVFGRRELLATGALTLGALVKATAAVPLLLFLVAIAAARPRGARARRSPPTSGWSPASASWPRRPS